MTGGLFADVDGFIAAHSQDWDRLEALTSGGGRRAAQRSPEELDELIVLYQRVSTHLSYARTYYGDPALTARLTGVVARAAAVIYGTRPRTLRAFARFFTETFPAAVWHARAFVLIATATSLLPAAVMALWLANSPAALDAAIPPPVQEALVASEFEDYYSSQPAGQFATVVTVNNIRVSFVAFAGGIAACLLTVYVLAMNGARVGEVVALFAVADQQPRFWGLLLPHGLLELTAVFIAGGAGLRLGWTLIDPGDRPRGEALVEEGRRAVVILLGLIVAFAVAGLIEGFVTGSGLPTWVRVGAGVLAEVTFLAYLRLRGRAAAAKGRTGAVGEEEAAWVGH